MWGAGGDWTELTEVHTQAEEVLEEKWHVMTYIHHLVLTLFVHFYDLLYVCCKLLCFRTDINIHLEKLVQSILGTVKLV